jgi:hypothetical protein
MAEWPLLRQSAVFSGITIGVLPLEVLCRRVWIGNIETDREVTRVKFEDGQEIVRAAIPLES